MEFRRVVVTGIGAVTPLGNTVDELWSNLINGVSGCEMITRYDSSKFKTRFACQVKNFDSEKYGIDRKEKRKLDLYAQYAIAAATDAMVDSSINLEAINLDKAGVVWASGIGGIETFLEEVKGFVTEMVLLVSALSLFLK
jgi:3-oxoacyl-[acyl-carrier-protein] synthase II